MTLTDLTAMQEAEGRVKAAREAFEAECVRCDQAIDVATESRRIAERRLCEAETSLRVLIAAARKQIDEREARAFAHLAEPPKKEAGDVTQPVVFGDSAMPARTISLNVSNEEQVAAE